MNFGFKLSKSSTVNLNNVDTHLYQHLCELEPDIKICMNCGSCGASCTAAPFSGMSIRKLILGLQRQQDVRKMLSNCMLCGKCTMVCPRGINTRKLLLTLSKIYD